MARSMGFGTQIDSVLPTTWLELIAPELSRDEGFEDRPCWYKPVPVMLLRVAVAGRILESNDQT